MPRTRKIVYQYSNPRYADEVEIDLTGELTFRVGEIVLRRWNHWRIDSVLFEDHVDDHKEMPTIWVFLVDAPVN